jgi:hypothetical protein
MRVGDNRGDPARLPRAARAVVALALAICGCTDDDAVPAADSPDAAATPVGEPALDARFLKVTLHRDFVCEGAAVGDIDRDGVADVVAGPDWYAGPSYLERHALWSRPPFDPKGYSDCFFEFVHDLDGDGWLDVLVVGFPGAGASWYENPGDGGGQWIRHDVIAEVDGESPAFVDVTGDGSPELLYMSGGRLGWAGPGDAAPGSQWPFHPLSDDRGYLPFTHGLGAGDVDGDGRVDVIEATGYFLRPASLDADPMWPRRDQAFGPGGAQMFASDVDGDGDADVVTALAAHGYGLAWFEQLSQSDPSSFVEHEIVPATAPAENAGNAEVTIHEPHAVAMADIDADGLDDIVTGERFWGHVPEGDPDFAAPARLYWFRLERTATGAQYKPTLIDDDSGVGTQLTTADVNADGRVDLIIANKKGAFLFLQTSSVGAR